MSFQILFDKSEKAFAKTQVIVQNYLKEREMREYPDAAAAKRDIDVVKQHCKEEGIPCPKMRIQKIVTAAWEEREAKRLRDGTYTPLPEFIREAYWYRSSTSAHKHYAHVSKVDPTKIAFTETPEKGERDIQLSMSASAYLARFFKDVLSQQEIRAYGARFFIGDFDLKIGNTPEDFERVYEGSPNVCADGGDYESCMRYNRNHWGFTRHPSYAYGAGDLAIAWIEDEDTILGRVVIWPEKKVYVRVYGLTPEHKEWLHAKLKEMGYSRENDTPGARLLKVEAVPTEEEDNSKNLNATLYKRYLMPYVDGNRWRVLQETPDGFFMLTDRYSDDGTGNNADTTEGYVTVYQNVTCAKTGRVVSGREITFVDGQPWSHEARRNASLSYCEDLNGYTQEQVRDICSNGVMYTWRQSIIDAIPTFICEYSGRLCDARYDEAIQVNTRYGIQTWSKIAARGNYRRENDGTYWRRVYQRPTATAATPEPAPTPEVSPCRPRRNRETQDVMAYAAEMLLGQYTEQFSTIRRTFHADRLAMLDETENTF